LFVVSFPSTVELGEKVEELLLSSWANTDGVFDETDGVTTMPRVIQHKNKS
jgi:hypothetical protein